MHKSPEEIIEQLKEEESKYGKFSISDYEKLYHLSMEKLQTHIKKCDQLQLLSGMVKYGLSGVANDRGETLIDIETYIDQAQIELIQGIALSQKRGTSTPNAYILECQRSTSKNKNS